MFVTVPRMRSYGYSRSNKQQEEEKPEPGMDSTYGVRSFGSVDSDWGSSSEAREEVTAQADGSSLDPDIVEEEDTSRAAEEQEVELPPVAVGTTEEWTPTVDRSAPLPQTPSPTIPSPHLSLSHAYLHERERDNLSEPSSPASFASMPSYMSSLSRTSSLAEAQAPLRSDHGVGIGMGGSEELVLPTINVSQSQTAPRWRGTPAQGEKGLKVVLLGEQARMEAFIAELSEMKEVVELSSGSGSAEYAVVGGDNVVALLSTESSAEDVETRLEEAYASLDSVLHPDPSPHARHRLQELALDYAAKSDWVHLLFVLEAEASSIDALAQLVPTLSPTSTSTRLLQLPVASQSSPPRSFSLAPDPTPRPGAEDGTSSYFSSHPLSSSHEAQQLVQALTQIDVIRQASINRFFTWRPNHTRTPTDLASSHTSHESSSAFEAAPMPTVARAQGGGEWEANLSRRLAKRRQSEDQQQQQQHQAGVSTPARRGGKRRSSGTAPNRQARKKAEACGPLFPFSIPSDPFGDGGKRPLLGEVLGGLRKQWKWGALAAAAVALVIGWNWVKSA